METTAELAMKQIEVLNGEVGGLKKQLRKEMARSQASIVVSVLAILVSIVAVFADQWRWVADGGVVSVSSVEASQWEGDTWMSRTSSGEVDWGIPLWLKATLMNTGRDDAALTDEGFIAPNGERVGSSRVLCLVNGTDGSTSTGTCKELIKVPKNESVDVWILLDGAASADLACVQSGEPISLFFEYSGSVARFESVLTLPESAVCDESQPKPEPS